MHAIDSRTQARWYIQPFLGEICDRFSVTLVWAYVVSSGWWQWLFAILVLRVVLGLLVHSWSGVALHVQLCLGLAMLRLRSPGATLGIKISFISNRRVLGGAREPLNIRT